MKNIIILTLTTVRYTGDSIGDDVRIEGSILNKKFALERKIKKGETVNLNLEIGRVEMGKPSMILPITIQVTEKDILFPDVGKKTETMSVDVNGERVQNKVITVEVREKKLRAGKRKALFDITCQVTIQKDQEPSFANKSIAWWEEWKMIKQYSYRGVNGKEDYNRYDPIIKSMVAKWNKEFCDDLFPPDEPLDPNLVKAIIFQESRVGYDRAAGINVMQVGNIGDPSLKTLRGELKEYWIHNGKLQELTYDARVTTVEESILWGTRWLYHKAQENVSDIKRSWRSWKEAVERYGPPRKAYVESVWSIYKNGIKKEKNKTITLWSISALLIAIGIAFMHQLIQPSLAASVMQTIQPDERIYIEDILAGYGSDQSLFWSIIAREKDWWEDIYVGRKQGANIQWLTMKEKPSEQSILKARFLQLKGFANPIFEVYGETHVGYGSLYLYELRDDHIVLLLETPAVDFKADAASTPDNYARYGYIHCGEIFRGGILQGSYKDVNNDGFSDVQLQGTADMICDEEGLLSDGEEQKRIRVATREIKKSFIWNNQVKLYNEKGT